MLAQASGAQGAAAHRDELVEVDAGDVGQANQVLPELGPAFDLLAAVQEAAHLLLRHAVQLLQEVLGLPLQQQPAVLSAPPPATACSPGKLNCMGAEVMPQEVTMPSRNQSSRWGLPGVSLECVSADQTKAARLSS